MHIVHAKLDYVLGNVTGHSFLLDNSGAFIPHGLMLKMGILQSQPTPPRGRKEKKECIIYL